MSSVCTCVIRMLLVVGGSLGLVVAPVRAQTPSEQHVSELVRQALQSAQAANPALSAPAPLSLDEAIRLALDRNLDIAVERLNPQMFDLSLAQIQSAYRPVFTSSFGQRSQVNPPANQLVGGTRVENNTLTYNAGFSQNVLWGGGTFGVSWNNSRTETSNVFSNFNPSYNSVFTANYTQPLLRGFSIDARRQQLRVTQINRDISEVQLQSTIINTLASVRNAYWDLVYAVEAVNVAAQSLALAERLVEDNRVRVEIGTMAPIDIVQAEAEAAIRRQALAQIESTHWTSELALKRLIVSGTDDPLWSTTIEPIDRPLLYPEPVDLHAAVRRALDQRTDLRQARQQIESNNVTLRFLRNQTLPAVDLVASYGVQGLGGTRFIRDGGLGGEVRDTIPGGYWDALSAISRRDFPAWNLSINISYPIGSSAADAQLARARVQLGQTQAQLRALELQVATEVTSAGLQVQNNLKRVEAAIAARELAQRRLEAEESRFEVGLSTNFFVVQAQRDLADAQNAELRALLDHRKWLVEFDRVQESSLGRAGVTLIPAGAGQGGAGGGQQ